MHAHQCLEGYRRPQNCTQVIYFTSLEDLEDINQIIMIRWFVDIIIPLIAVVGTYVAFGRIQQVQESIEDEKFFDIDEVYCAIIQNTFSFKHRAYRLVQSALV